MAIGEPAYESDEYRRRRHAELGDGVYNIELLTASGHARSGALCLLQRSVKPHVLNSFTIGGTLRVWALYADAPDPAVDATGDAATMHRFVLLSRLRDTIVLQTGDDGLQEVEEGRLGFYTAGPTVFACNMRANRFIVQAIATGVWLLENGASCAGTADGPRRRCAESPRAPCHRHAAPARDTRTGAACG